MTLDWFFSSENDALAVWLTSTTFVKTADLPFCNFHGKRQLLEKKELVPLERGRLQGAHAALVDTVDSTTEDATGNKAP